MVADNAWHVCAELLRVANPNLQSRAPIWLMGATTAIMLFGSALLHELGHSVVALRFKVPVRSITLFNFGGVAQIGTELPSAKAGPRWIRHRLPSCGAGNGGIGGLRSTW